MDKNIKIQQKGAFEFISFNLNQLPIVKQNLIDNKKCDKYLDDIFINQKKK